MRSKTSLTAALSAALMAIVATAEIRTLSARSDTYATATSAYAVGNFARAERLFAVVARENPDHIRTLQGLAMAQLQNREIEAARASVAALIAKEPSNACHLAVRGILNDIAGNHRSAVADYANAAAGCAAANRGATWWQRMTRDVHAHTPAVAKRLAYLRREL
ncbi:MAG: tetratricopeptide repeat protein, partial [Pseudomonadota bacterium]